MIEGEKLIASNPNAARNYAIEELVEAGIQLTGTEVKSMRDQSPNLRDAFVEVNSKSNKVEAWLVNAHIGPYKHGNIWNHEPLRRRKLLLHHHQIEKIHGAITQKGIVVIPTRIYFKKGLVKVELGLGKGKRKGDRREDDKRKTDDREIDQALKRSRQEGK